MKKNKTKIMIIIAVFVMLTFFLSDFSLIDIQKTALIVALGIDKVEDEFEITAQIAVPQATDQTANNDDTTLTSKGKTIFEAIDKMGTETGWYPKLSFCDLIIFGKSAVEAGLSPDLEFLAASKRVQNSALVACADGSAKEIMTSATPLDAISSFAIQKILLKNTLKVSNVCHNNIRKFGIMTLSPAQVSFMPIIKLVENKESSESNGSSSQMANATEKDGSLAVAEQSSGGSSGGAGGQKTSYVFDASNTAIFKDGKKVCELNSDESLLYNLANKMVDESFFSVDSPKGSFLLSITKNSNRQFVTFGEKPTLNLHLTLVVATVDSKETQPFSTLQNKTKIDPETIKSAEQKFEGIFNVMAEKLGKADADLFQAKNIIYKFHHKYYDDLKDLHTDNFNFSTKVTVKSID